MPIRPGCNNSWQGTGFQHMVGESGPLSYNRDDRRKAVSNCWMWVVLRHIKNKEPFMNDIRDEITSLKVRENATILAHCYQDGDIQELADYTGDSLKLARAATTVHTGTIVFCGVHFMAETAKMLN